ncbi:hypothetical protein GCM10010983_04150 [Caulobacter rhizosphaerae]|jgi:hypothetical protein|nr:hypothetical protein [Caulobacter rhizosphaerae]GGL10173.1 hypothetical protein GCM10010983_04150 [Caulobacter rhizosphaerae]
MPETPLLWRSSARKEALELLEHLWNTGDEDARARLSEVIAAGPPAHLGPQDASPEDRRRSIDRRIFDRVALLERDGRHPLTPELQALIAGIRASHPEWHLAAGEIARFGWWMEVGGVDDGGRHLGNLSALETADAIIDYLAQPRDDDRFGEAEDAWRRLVIDRPERAAPVLARLAARGADGLVGVWRATLWGVRDHAKDPAYLDPALQAILASPRVLFSETEFSRAVADLLEAGVQGAKTPPGDPYWQVFDLTLAAASGDPANGDDPGDGHWVSLAINRSLGHLATAFFNGLFAHRLKTGDGLPAPLLPRLQRLIGLGERTHRPSRVIAASRIPYLFAVDPTWTARTLLPLLDWDADPTEAAAAWQGFSWHPRIGQDLWDLIRQPFLAAFDGRLETFGASKTALAQILMLAGLDFGLGPDLGRAAIRAMSDEMRGDATWWLWNDLNRISGGEPDQPTPADARWRGQVQPWLAKAWPRDPQVKTPRVSENLALAATATSQAFPEAVDFLSAFLVASDGGLLLDRLTKGGHPDRHPAHSLRLLGLAVRLEVWTDRQELAALLARIVAADPALRDDAVYRRLDLFVRAAQG